MPCVLAVAAVVSVVAIFGVLAVVIQEALAAKRLVFLRLLIPYTVS